jgi:hypothetical protein
MNSAANVHSWHDPRALAMGDDRPIQQVKPGQQDHQELCEHDAASTQKIRYPVTCRPHGVAALSWWVGIRIELEDASSMVSVKTVGLSGGTWIKSRRNGCLDFA